MSGRRLWRLVLVIALGLGLPMSAAAQDVVEYFGTDAIGSVRIVFDANGNIVGRTDYGPFGEQLSASTVGHNSFAGLFRDGEAGLDYAEARSYQVRTGRFSAPDPVYAALFQPQAWNRYSYGFNNPLTFSDPSGLCPDGHYCETVTVTATPTSANASDPGRTNAWGVIGVGGEGFYAIDLQGLDQGDSGGSGGFVMGVIDAILGTEGVGGPDSEQVATGNNNPRTSILTTAAAIVGGVLLSKLPRLGSNPTTPPNRIYSARELVRRANEPGPFHNFPESLNDPIFNLGSRTATANFWTTPRPGLSMDSVMYQLRGSVNGQSGTFEMAVRPSVTGRTEVIMHRFFRPDR